MNLFEKTVEKNYVYEGKIISVRRDKAEHPDGTPCVREVVEHNGGVCVAPLTDNDELIFVRQFRYPYGEVVLELPAGKLEKGEDDGDAGMRELEEEIGISIEEEELNLVEVYKHKNYFMDIFVVKSDIDITALVLQPEEVVDAKWVSDEELLRMIKEKQLVWSVGLRYGQYRELLG